MDNMFHEIRSITSVVTNASNISVSQMVMEGKMNGCNWQIYKR